MRKIKKLLSIGIVNTIRFNFSYFGIKGLIELPVIVSRYVTLRSMKGSVICLNARRGGVEIGFSDLGIISERHQPFIWENNGQVVFHGTVNLGKAMCICNMGKLEFENDASFVGNSKIICRKEITFGEGCLISWECLIMDTDWHPLYDLEHKGKIINNDKSIRVGKNVWIGNRCMILKGADIPHNSIVAANSKISKELSESYVIYGDRGKIIARNVGWKNG